MNQIKAILIVIAIAIQLAGCKKNSTSCKYDAEPPVFFFQIKQQEHPLPDDTLLRIKMFYTRDGNIKTITDLFPATDMYARQGILTSRQIGTFEQQTFFIDYPGDLSNDTLHVMNAMPSTLTNCQYQIEQINFNNQKITGDTGFGYRPVYVFNKSK